MSDSNHDSGMTEIALALAMAFFAIMILALVTMGVPSSADGGHQVISIASATAEGGPQDPTGGPQNTSDHAIVIHWQGAFFDDQFRPFALDQLDGPIALAVDPSLPMADAVTLRQQFEAVDLVITPLTEGWLEYLRNSEK